MSRPSNTTFLTSARRPMVARRHDLFRSPAAVPAKLVPAKTTRTSALSMVQFQKAVSPRHGGPRLLGCRRM
jgi:hypothetical protein